MVENGIQMYFHCKNCLEANRRQQLAVGWTIKGVQVWCETCETNVTALDFRGMKVAHDTDPKNPPVESPKDVN